MEPLKVVDRKNEEGDYIRGETDYQGLKPYASFSVNYFQPKSAEEYDGLWRF